MRAPFLAAQHWYKVLFPISVSENPAAGSFLESMRAVPQQPLSVVSMLCKCVPSPTPELLCGNHKPQDNGLLSQGFEGAIVQSSWGYSLVARMWKILGRLQFLK